MVCKLISVSIDDVIKFILIIKPSLIESYGYACETHTITTKDGYILTLHRIPGRPKQNEGNKNTNQFPYHRRTPVFLGHSVVGSSAIWAFAPNHSLAYTLADEGK